MTGRAGRLLLLAGLALALASCADDRHRRHTEVVALPFASLVREARIVDTARPLECVPFARRLSGIRLRGDAWTWWDGAAGRYARGHTPAPGAVLVFRRDHGSLGHLAVVRRVVSPRLIVADHADWLNSGRIHQGTPIADTSPAGDWSAVRVWFIPGASWGRRVYPVYGFIYPGRAVADRDAP